MNIIKATTFVFYAFSIKLFRSEMRHQLSRKFCIDCRHPPFKDVFNNGCFFFKAIKGNAFHFCAYYIDTLTLLCHTEIF